MSNLNDDNYGNYECEPGDEEETLRFYKEVQQDSVWKKCQGCERRVKLRRDYAYCNSCATKREQGWDI